LIGQQPKGKKLSILEKFLRKVFFDEVILPVLDFLHPKGRGPHKGREIFTKKMKIFCGHVYCLCEYFLKEPRKDWPKEMEDAVALLEKPVESEQKKRGK